VLGVLHDEPFTGLGLKGPVEIAYGGNVMPTVIPLVLHPEIEIRDGGIALDGIYDSE